ncbi:hypothetical protein KC353_g15233 [Hortaea werneckii]|nr:hypothetical protein KC353_g15233 [Hortaea werneckii]
MAAGFTRLIEISFVLRDRVAPKNAEDIDEEINSFQFLPPFLLYASGFLFMGATEEQMQLLSDAGVTHVSYILILYSIAFLLFLFVNMLLHLYSYYTASSSKGKGPSKRHDEEHSMPNGHARAPAMTERQAQDAQEFELEGLITDDEDEDGGKKHSQSNGRAQ